MRPVMGGPPCGSVAGRSRYWPKGAGAWALPEQESQRTISTLRDQIRAEVPQLQHLAVTREKDSMDDGLAECCGQGGRGERRSGWAPWTAHRRVLFRRQSDTTKDSGHAPSGHCVDNSPAALDGGTNRPRHLRDFRYRRRQTRGTPARDPATKVTHARLIVCDGRHAPRDVRDLRPLPPPHPSTPSGDESHAPQQRTPPPRPRPQPQPQPQPRDNYRP